MNENMEISQVPDNPENQRRTRREVDPVSYVEVNTVRGDKYNQIKYSEPNNEEFIRALQTLVESSKQPNRNNLKKYIKNKLEKESLKIWQKFWDEAEVGR